MKYFHINKLDKFYMAINQEFKDLISEIKYRYKLKQSQIADRLGVKSTYLSDMINGRVPLSENISSKIAETWHDNPANTFTIKERLTEFAKSKEKSVSAFEINAGLTIGYINAIRVSIQPDKLQSIASHYPDLNTGWLMTGEGEMLKTEKDNKLGICDGPYELVPLYNFDAVGGMNTSNKVIDSIAYVERHIAFNGAKPDDIAIHVTGNSMIPTYSPGSILLVREVHNWKEYFGYGNNFVIFLNDGRRILKTVQKSLEDTKQYVLCSSINNIEYPEEELPRSMIVRVYKVVMSLNNEGF